MSEGKKEKINVLSLFDGMSCGQIALNKVGIEYEKYFASEIDKYAMFIAKKNFPNIKHIGDVTKVYMQCGFNIQTLIRGTKPFCFIFVGRKLKFEYLYINKKKIL